MTSQTKGDGKPEPNYTLNLLHLQIGAVLLEAVDTGEHYEVVIAQGVRTLRGRRIPL